MTEPALSFQQEQDAADVTTHWLTGIGPTDWAEMARTFSGWSAFWQGADGLHLEPVPDEQPWATHLWCWHESGCSARIRVDDVCLAAILGPDQDHLVSVLPTAHSVEQVPAASTSTVRGPGDELSLVLWEGGDRVPPLPADLIDADRPWSQIVTLAASPITFLRRDDR